MAGIANVILPFFALVLCGYLAVRQRLLPESAIAGLNSFVLYFALPCMLFRFGVNTPLAELLAPAVLLLYTAVALLMVGLIMALTLGPQLQRGNAAFGALVGAFPNSGYMGVPLLAALLGPAAVGTVICTTLVDLVLTSSLCLALAQSGAGHASWRSAWLQALRGPLTNPLPWAVGLGVAAGLSGLHLPAALDNTVRLLGDAASPVALFTLGAVLRREQHQAQGAAQAGHTSTAGAVTTVVLAKLLLHPLLVLLLGLGARRYGLNLSDLQLQVLTLTAALPSASNVSLLAERYGADNGRIAKIILGSTSLAFVSFSLWAWALGAAR
ncbi:AEC family transporter [Roseateles sp. BYS180W]|uniref:AEC family transporter n=1 Tax=Roseateles rivi TaxID=3299028 RepID=A0ABW7FQW8_9BURK